jgi:hypothetical protein
MSQALVTRIVEEKLGHMEAVDEEVVVAHIALAEHHMVAAHNGCMEDVAQGIAAHNMEPG